MAFTPSPQRPFCCAGRGHKRPSAEMIAIRPDAKTCVGQVANGTFSILPKPVVVTHAWVKIDAAAQPSMRHFIVIPSRLSWAKMVSNVGEWERTARFPFNHRHK